MADGFAAIPALVPRGPGHQFVLYGDACSGVPGAPHERTFAAVNAVLRRLDPGPEFILFPGDEIIGLSADPDVLRAQWRHFHDVEMAWLDRARTPFYPCTANHTAYDAASEAVFRAAYDLPRNGPPGQEGLAYWVRRGDLLLIVTHTLWSGLGGEGHVETEWLDTTLKAHADARHTLVMGHHPVYPVNGFAGAYQRTIGPEHAKRFWDVLVAHGVLAYLCSHILAYDVQVHRGVLQITTAGAGTAHRMPEGIEYLHLVQAALDGEGLRCQVIDDTGRVRERLSWPLAEPRDWRLLPLGAVEAPVSGPADDERVVFLRLRGRTAAQAGAAQTVLSLQDPGEAVLAPLWIGLAGPEQRLIAVLGPQAGRSPGTWIGPALAPDTSFDFTLALHAGLGPGGLLLREGEDGPWSSLQGAAAWGLERLVWPAAWSLGHGQHGPDDRPFSGAELSVAVAKG
ncbi:MAG TPA: hypothetical protein VIL65_02305 [Beijerinckiaceae bacterium]|jgi:hypothetical protein